MKKLYFLFALCFSLAVKAQINLNASLTACYALNGNANEPVNNLNGTLSGVFGTTDRFNNPNSALYFTGQASSYVQLPNSALLKPNAVSFTGWLRTDSTNSQILVFARNACGVYHEGYQLALVSAGGGMLRLHLAKSTNNCSPGTQILLNGNTGTLQPYTWYHFGAYLGADSMKIYLNGMPDGAIANANPLNYGNTNVYLGGTNVQVNQPFNGRLDNMRFYNRKLSSAEFLAIYQQDPACVGNNIPTAMFSASYSPFCAKSPIYLYDLSTNTPTAWSWQMPGGSPATSSAANPTVTYNSPGIYSITLVATNGNGSSAPYTQTISVFPAPGLTVTPSSATICPGASVNFSASGAFTYSWTIPAYGPTATASPSVSMVYSLNATDSIGCNNSTTLSVIVGTCVALKEHAAGRPMKVFPSPAQTYIIIENASPQASTYELIDVQGRVIFRQRFAADEENKILLENISGGIYVLRQKSAGSVKSCRILKE